MGSVSEALEVLHRDLLQRFEAGDRDLAAIVESVPQLESVINRYEPDADAVIFRRHEVRDFAAAIVIEVLQLQARRRDNLCEHEGCAAHA